MKMQRLNLFTCAVCAGLMGIATTADGTVLVQYGFGGGSGPDAGSVAANLDASSVSGGSSSGRGDTSSNPYNDGNTRSIYWQVVSTGSASFTLDADSPYLVDYTRLVFKIDHETAVSDDQWYLQSDLTTGDILTGDITTAIDGNGTWTLADVNLSTVTELQGVDAVTFTVGFRGVSTAVNTSTTRIDKIQVEGVVADPSVGAAIPEPVTFAMLGIGAGVLMLRRNRA